jgi:phosphatidylinositol alpha-1,6-mannosyltransferase
MSVLIITPEFPPQFGGIGTHCYEMAKHWSTEVEVTVLAGSTTGPRPRATFPFCVIDVPYSRSRAVRLWRTTASIRRVLSAKQFDAVYVAHWRTSGVPFRLATARSPLRARYIQAIHGGEILYFLRRRRRGLLPKTLFRWTTARVDRFVALGQYQAQLLDEVGIDGRRVFASPEGVDVSAFHPDGNREQLTTLRRRHALEGKRVLLTVSRLSEIKGHDMVIRALPRILREVPNTVYVIVGSGPQEAALRSLATATGVAERVVFSGFVPDAELPAYYSLCDVFIMPSRELDYDTEGFGIVFMEAAACGKPTVGGRTGGIVEAIQDHETGLLVDPASVARIAEAAVTLLTDDALAGRMGQAGRRRVVEAFQYKHIARRILSVCLPSPAAAKLPLERV